MSPTIFDIEEPAYIGGPAYQQTTPITIVYRVKKNVPTETFNLGQSLISSYIKALDLITLAKQILPDSQPLTPEERTSINEFFWSNFK